MAEPKFEDVGAWLRDNPDKEGTSDYVHMANAYRALHPDKPSAPPPPAGSAKSFTEDLWGRAKAGLGINDTDRSISDWWNGKAAPEPKPVPGSENVPSIDDLMTAKRLTSDPYNADNTIGRVVAGAIGGIPDLAIGGYNAGARFIGSPKSQAEYVTPKMLANSGTAALPADAGLARQLLEAGGSAFLGGGAGAATGPLQAARVTAATTGKAIPIISTTARMAAPTVVPTVAGHYGGEGGAQIGKLLGDEETGRYIGSLLGGSVLAAKPAAQSIIHQLYAGEGRADAPQIAAAAARQGVTPTAGMLGNESILRLEQKRSGQAGAADVIQEARSNARNQIGAAADRSAVERGSTAAQPTEGTIGAKLSQAAGESAESLRAASDARQSALTDRIGADTPVAVDPVRERGYSIMTDPNARLMPTQRLAIDQRLTDELPPLITRNAGGDPIQQPIGTGGRMSDTAPYGDFAGFRTELGKSIERGGARQPATAELYPPATDVMREAAVRQGVDPRNFNNVNDMTRAIERTTPATPGGPIGDYPTLQRYINEDPARAYSYLNSGYQNPNVPGILEATGHPLVREILGDQMRLVANQTINNPQGGARRPAQYAEHYTGMEPESRAISLGDQLANVSDQVGLARALDIPPQQNGLTRSVGGQNESVGRMLVGQETLGRAGGAIAGWPGELAGRIAGVLGMPAVRHLLGGILEGPTVRNALAGGQGPGGINQLGAALAAIQAEQQQNRPVR
jgi:hypothetical protein